MRPLLALHADGGEKTQSELRGSLAESFAVTPAELDERIPSGTAYTFANRVAWASTHMKQAGLIIKPRRGISQITDRGRAVLEQYPDRIDIAVLEQFPEYMDFRTRSRRRPRPATTAESTDSETPEEMLDAAYNELREALIEELRVRLVTAEDSFFEDVVLDVLVGLGYGGSKRDAAERVGRSGDGGVDGVIREDTLGLDAIYVQAKKWARDRTIGPRDIREFIGALQDAEAIKGVFITTSSFSSEARKLARRRRVVLIDGAELANLMVDAGVGVTSVRRFEIMRVDEDYFTEPG
jgi:restriction system protein